MALARDRGVKYGIDLKGTVAGGGVIDSDNIAVLDVPPSKPSFLKEMLPEIKLPEVKLPFSDEVGDFKDSIDDDAKKFKDSISGKKKKNYSNSRVREAESRSEEKARRRLEDELFLAD